MGAEREGEEVEIDSEFGKGCVYNLILFTNHFSNQQAEAIRYHKMFIDMDDEKRALALSNNPPPNLNYGRPNEDARWWFEKIVPIYGDPTRALESEITTWANGASDHLYELEIPESFKNKEIASKLEWIKETGLDMGHGRGLMGETRYGYEEFIKLWNSVKEVGLMIDKELGLEPIKGQWE